MDMDMHHEHGHVPWTWTRTIDMDIHHGNGHAPWTCLYGIDMDINHYWTGALGRKYAKVRNYVYIDIVLTRNYEISVSRNYMKRNFAYLSVSNKTIRNICRMLLSFAKRYDTKFRMFSFSRNTRNFTK